MDKPKILYVDDESVNLLLFKTNLKKQYQVITATDGQEGLGMIDKHDDIQIVFSDMKMPGMNGLEFIQNANSKTRHNNFYILTGYEITEDIESAIGSGLIRRYFKKPLSMEEIINEIEHVVNNGANK